MDKLKKLENVKLMKEFDFVESEYNLKNEIVVEADSNFLKTVNSYLSERPDLKKLFDDKVDKKIKEMLEKKKQEDENKNDIGDELNEHDELHTEVDTEEQKEKEESPKEEENKIGIRTAKIRRLYREIAKITHPDKIKNKKLNALYIKATDYYEENNIIGIYAVCNELEIDYEIDETDNIYLIEKIGSLKERIRFLESTYTWKWQHCPDEKEKENIILNYIKSQLNN